MQRRWPFCIGLILVLVLSTAFVVTTHAVDSHMDVQMERKVEHQLLEAIQRDGEAKVRADIMIQLQSPSEIIDQTDDAACGQSRAEKTTCMVDSLEKFAEQNQQRVKEVLNANPNEFRAPPTFFWINNSVSVKQASGKLIRLLAQIEQVKHIRGELVFQLYDGSKQQQQEDEEGDRLW